MPTGDTLTPREAARIATNSYFTLKGWVDKEPTAAMESKSVIMDRVLGQANIGAENHSNTSLLGTGLNSANISNVHQAQTGFGTTSGFGYTLVYQGNGLRHVVIATRGTRPEMAWKPDLITDLNAAYTSFDDYGSVHNGFKKTFDSILPSIERDLGVITSSDVVHCVGHSLGGAVATLIAAHFAAQKRNVKLYTFGSPRVGLLNTHQAFESRIGVNNIYRVAHDLDPITLIAPYPYVHVLPKPSDQNNMTLLSPTGQLFSTANHDMAEYINSVSTLDWDGVRRMANAVNHSDSVLAKWLLRDDADNGWLAYGCKKALALLFKLFRYALRAISTTVNLGLTAIDLLAEILYKGLHKMAELGGQILKLLGYAAVWAGIQAVKVADFTTLVIQVILDKMLSAIRALSSAAIDQANRNIAPAIIGMGGALILSGASAF